MNFRESVRLDLNFVIRSHINYYKDIFILYCTGTGSIIPTMIYKNLNQYQISNLSILLKRHFTKGTILYGIPYNFSTEMIYKYQVKSARKAQS